MNSYRDLEVWRESMELAVAAYRITRDFPREEMFGLTGQMRRATSSVPFNIAEGYARRGGRQFLHFCYIARGSLAESETQLELARRLGYVESAAFEALWERMQVVGRLLNGLIRKLEQEQR